MTTYRVLEDVSGTVNVSHLGAVDFEFPAGPVTVDEPGSADAAVLESLAASGLAELVDNTPSKRGRRKATDDTPGETAPGTTTPDADNGDATPEV